MKSDHRMDRNFPIGTEGDAANAVLVTYLHCSQVVSYARMVEILDGVFGLTISEGAIAKMLARTKTPLAAAADKIAATVRASAVIASDETSARVEGKTVVAVDVQLRHGRVSRDR